MGKSLRAKSIALNVNFQNSPSLGVSLLSAMIAVAITGIGALGITKVFDFGVRGQRSLEFRSDKEAIKRFLLTNVNCSLTAKICKPGKLQALYRADSNGKSAVVVPINGKKYGDTLVRGECNENGDGIIVRAVNVTAKSTATRPVIVPDPLTGRKITFSSDESLLFPAGIDLCSAVEEQQSADPYPEIVRCKFNYINSKQQGTADFRRATFYPKNNNNMYNEVVSYQGISSGGVERVMYRQGSGMIVGMAHGVSYIPTPWGKYTYNTYGPFTTIYDCPRQLKLDGRRIQAK